MQYSWGFRVGFLWPVIGGFSLEMKWVLREFVVKYCAARYVRMTIGFRIRLLFINPFVHFMVVLFFLLLSLEISNIHDSVM